jgi:hypothetical protein
MASLSPPSARPIGHAVFGLLRDQNPIHRSLDIKIIGNCHRAPIQNPACLRLAPLGRRWRDPQGAVSTSGVAFARWPCSRGNPIFLCSGYDGFLPKGEQLKDHPNLRRGNNFCVDADARTDPLFSIRYYLKHCARMSACCASMAREPSVGGACLGIGERGGRENGRAYAKPTARTRPPSKVVRAAAAPG